MSCAKRAVTQWLRRATFRVKIVTSCFDAKVGSWSCFQLKPSGTNLQSQRNDEVGSFIFCRVEVPIVWEIRIRCVIEVLEHFLRGVLLENGAWKLSNWSSQSISWPFFQVKGESTRRGAAATVMRLFCKLWLKLLQPFRW